MKLIRRILWVLFGFIGCLILGCYLFLRSSLAPLDGEIALKNLSNPVQIRRDNYGIPHIKAETKKDALRALGYVLASERLFQMEISRRMTQGELSEVFGEIALPTDKLYRSLMLKRSVERMIANEKATGRFDQEMWDEMEAYFDGVNQYITTHPLPYELQILGIKPRPFSPIDSFILVGHMAYSFALAMKADPLYTKLAQKFSYPVLQSLRNDPLTLPQQTAQNLFNKLSPLNPMDVYPLFEGSNAWLVSPERSNSGRSLFMNDPHISYSMPAVWIEAHISTPQFELYGHYLPLVPFAILGHNQNHAWGFTMSLTDDMDLYRETLDRNNKTALFNNSPKPYLEWTERIKVKNQPEVALNLIETSHGPIMDEVLSEKNIALKWAFHSIKNNPLRALKKMAEATDIKTFESALDYGSAPGLNVLYADAKNIAWWIFGDIAIKKNPHSDLIFNGATGADEYDRLLSWEEKPHLINPPEGIIVSANCRPPQLNENIRGDWQAQDRFQTITQKLNEKKMWSAEEFKSLQTSNFNSQNIKILSELLKNLKVQQNSKYTKALGILKNWNFQSDISSQGASLFYEWNNQIASLLLADWDEADRKTYLELPHAWAFYERTILDDQSPWWKEKNKAELITKAFETTFEKLSHLPRWGELHTIEYIHPLGRRWPLSLFLNLGPYEIPGGFNEINNNKAKSLTGDFKVVAGPSTRRIIDFANPQKSWGINPIGQSGHILSPYYSNQIKLFINGEYRAQLLDEQDIEQQKTHSLTLNPLK